MSSAVGFACSAPRSRYCASHTCRRLRRTPIRTFRSKSASNAGAPGRRLPGLIRTAGSKRFRACSAGKPSPMACGAPPVRCSKSGRRRPRPAGDRRAKAKGRKAKVASVARKYLIETFGCQMNVHDSERMAGLLEQAGFEATTEASDADVVVINTCSVRERAEEKLYTRLGELRQMALDAGPMVEPPVVAVAGCVAQQEGEAIVRRSAGVADIVVGTQAIRKLPMLVDQAAAVPARRRTLPLIDLSAQDDVTWPL